MASSIRKIAIYEDRATRTIVERYRLQRFDKSWTTIDVSPSVADDGRSLRAMLLDAGSALRSDPSKLAKAIEFARSSTAPKHYVYEAKTGWKRRGSAFVLQSETIGDARAPSIGIAPLRSGSRGKVRNRGSSENWITTVGELACCSTAMMFAISAAFAAPLLKVAGESSFGICFFGRTRGGKTTATLAAGSVIGFGRDEQLLHWYSTTAGLEPYFHAYNDHVLPIDDLSKLPAKTDNERYSEVRDLAYKAIGGDVKGRHPSFTDSTATRGGQYRFIVLTSYEKSLQQLAEDTGQARMGGESIRLIDVPAYYDCLDHIFDRAHSKSRLSQGNLNRLFARTREAMGNNHGHIFRRYLRHLIRERATVARIVDRHQRDFVRTILRKGDSPDVADLARRCGLIYAAGQIAIRCDALRWKKADLREAIVKAFNGARQLFVDNNLITKRGRKSLRKRLKTLPKRDSLVGRNIERIDGFRESSEEHDRYVIKTEAFGKVFRNRHEKELVMKSLLQDGCITLAGGNVAGAVRAQGQFVWPNGKRIRSYEIKWRRKADTGRHPPEQERR